MSVSSNYAPFNENNEINFNNNYNNIINFERTFENLISERGEDLNINTINYNTLFERIKTKLLKLNNLECDLNQFPEIIDFKNEINLLKKNACDTYIELVKSENLLNESKEKYTLFCENIKLSISSIESCGLNKDSDNLLKEILENKIEEYYTNLNLDSLNANYNEMYINFEKVKSKINMITGNIIPTTICSICLENQIEFFIDPCGHTLCKICKDKCEISTNCHICRLTKRGYKRLYL